MVVPGHGRGVSEPRLRTPYDAPVRHFRRTRRRTREFGLDDRPLAARRRAHPRRGRGHPDALGRTQGAAPDRRAAACSGTPCTRSPSSSPSTSSWCSGTAASRCSEAVTALGDELARPVTVAVQEQRLGTGHAVRCGLDALPGGITGPVLVTYGDVPLLDRRHAGRAAGRAHRVRGRGHPAHHRARRPHRLRPRGARAGRHRHADRRAGRRHRRSSGRSARSTPASTRSTRAFLADGARPAVAPTNTQGELYLTDLVEIAHDDGAPGARACAAPTTWQVRGVNDRVQLAALRRRAEPAAAASGGCAPASPWSTRPPRGWTCRSGWSPTSCCARAPSCTAPPRSAAAPRSARTPRSPTSRSAPAPRVVRTHGSDAEIGAGRDRRPVRLPAAGRAARRARQDRHVRRGEELRDRRGHEGAAPHLRRRRHDRRAQQHRRVARCSSTTTGCASTARSSARTSRTGSDNTFVAPVSRRRRRVHRGRAPCCASDVPPGALAVSAGAQRNIEGWVETQAARHAGRRGRRARAADARPIDGRGGTAR